MLRLIILVCFVMTMFLWLLSLLEVMPTGPGRWLPWFAALFLGVAVFVPSPPYPRV